MLRGFKSNAAAEGKTGKKDGGVAVSGFDLFNASIDDGLKIKRGSGHFVQIRIINQNKMNPSCQ